MKIFAHLTDPDDPATVGFYREDYPGGIPEGAFEITKKQHETYLDNQHLYAFVNKKLVKVKQENKSKILAMSLSYWRSSMDLWMGFDTTDSNKSRLTILYETVTALEEKRDIRAKILKQEIEYSPNITIEFLLKFKDIIGLTEEECQTSLDRAYKIEQGDYEGL
jgi:hypothetical protein